MEFCNRHAYFCMKKELKELSRTFRIKAPAKQNAFGIIDRPDIGAILANVFQKPSVFTSEAHHLEERPKQQQEGDRGWNNDCKPFEHCYCA